MRNKKDTLTKKEYIFDEPTCIDSGEIRIIDNCTVIINVPVTVHGTLIFYNCSVTINSQGIAIYGSLKMDKCHICPHPNSIRSLKRENITIPDNAEIIEVEFEPCGCGYNHNKHTPFTKNIGAEKQTFPSRVPRLKNLNFDDLLKQASKEFIKEMEQENE